MSGFNKGLRTSTRIEDKECDGDCDKLVEPILVAQSGSQEQAVEEQKNDVASESTESIVKSENDFPKRTEEQEQEETKTEEILSADVVS